MFRSVIAAVILGVFTTQPAAAQTREFGLSSPSVLQESGFLRFILPRFSLKTGIRVSLQSAAAEATFSPDTGTPVMQGLGVKIYLQLGSADTPRQQNARRFADWLLSDVGIRTIGQFKIDGAPVFTILQPEATTIAPTVFTGSAARGESFSYANCGRCHVVGPANRMQGIGSTPSFSLLRSLPDWQDRFLSFFTRNPHPAFTQVTGITTPFDPDRPPSIAPVILEPADLDNILSFINSIEPADLGAPLVQN